MEDAHISHVVKVIKDNLLRFKWNILGIIDLDEMVYPITYDTKLLSKVFEITTFPIFRDIAKEISSEKDDCKIYFAKEQNQYPDITLTGGHLGDSKIALDIKSGYRTTDKEFSGFTLGAFNGYFKDRNSKKNIRFPYKEYIKHFAICILYDRELSVDTSTSVPLCEKDTIPNVITNVEVIVQEKWKIAGTSPGSGNTANIGSVKKISQLINGTGPFSSEGEHIFDDYWMYYIRKEDYKKIGLTSQPYNTLEKYKEWNKEGRKGASTIEGYYMKTISSKSIFSFDQCE